jgi:hypothetical protein
VTGILTLGATPAATGGSGSYTYRWSPGTNLSDSTLANPVVTITPSNIEYHLTVTDNVTGCSGVDSTHFTINTKPTVVITSPDTNLCAGQSTTLTATGGNPTGGTYQWSPTVGMTPSAGNTATVTVSPPGTQGYQVVYDAGGCYDTAYQTIHIYPVVVAHAGPSQTYCSTVTGTLTLGATPAATGGSGSYTYRWSPGTNLSDSTLANPVVTITPSNIEYHLTVTDNVTGCSGVDSTHFTINTKPIVTIAASDTNLCAGQQSVLTATGSNPIGGTYQWSPLVSITPAAGNTGTVTVTPPGNQTYFVVYNASGCYDTAYQTIHVYPTVVAHGGGPKNFCSPIDSVKLGAIPAATGGSGHYSYRWSPGTTLNDSVIANPIATPTNTITYYLTVTDSVTGCSSVDSVLVTRNPGPPARVGPNASICTGGSVSLTASGGTT